MGRMKDMAIEQMNRALESYEERHENIAKIERNNIQLKLQDNEFIMKLRGTHSNSEWRRLIQKLFDS